jgi:hypothetical protein
MIHCFVCGHQCRSKADYEEIREWAEWEGLPFRDVLDPREISLAKEIIRTMKSSTGSPNLDGVVTSTKQIDDENEKTFDAESFIPLATYGARRERSTAFEGDDIDDTGAGAGADVDGSDPHESISRRKTSEIEPSTGVDVDVDVDTDGKEMLEDGEWYSPPEEKTSFLRKGSQFISWVAECAKRMASPSFLHQSAVLPLNRVKRDASHPWQDDRVSWKCPSVVHHVHDEGLLMFLVHSFEIDVRVDSLKLTDLKQILVPVLRDLCEKKDWECQIGRMDEITPCFVNAKIMKKEKCIQEKVPNRLHYDIN